MNSYWEQKASSHDYDWPEELWTVPGRKSPFEQHETATQEDVPTKPGLSEKPKAEKPPAGPEPSEEPVVDDQAPEGDPEKIEE